MFYGWPSKWSLPLKDSRNIKGVTSALELRESSKIEKSRTKKKMKSAGRSPTEECMRAHEMEEWNEDNTD
ncbi:hypothetical protein EVAR_10786_1 [Eumeta japonica]|uniref:Uncharacterized protein n=1 Tax=Eumeta variegata TaxID=151549 RepID=A0A4C1W639_EUMVA|nr:hypothetical protein EVAR_10786_1 [Eumeta japonica]